MKMVQRDWNDETMEPKQRGSGMRVHIAPSPPASPTRTGYPALQPQPSSPNGGPRSPTKVINWPPFSPITHKYSMELESREVTPSPEHSRHRLPGISRGMGMGRSPPGSPSRLRSPYASQAFQPPPSPTFAPLQLLPMPAMLCFESWWQEAGQMVHVWVDYETAAQMATASVHVAVNARLGPVRSSAYVDPWDLHVGARLWLLGRKLTLRRARDAVTTRWLDQQALQLRRQRAVLERELRKYRQVAGARWPRRPAQRAEPLDSRVHSAVPLGGKTNLRNLRDDIVHLASVLRQHQIGLPILSLPPNTLAETLEGPEDWSPERQQAEAEAAAAAAARRAEEERAAQAAEEEAARKKALAGIEWLASIPLAASAARLSQTGPGGKPDARQSMAGSAMLSDPKRMSMAGNNQGAVRTPPKPTPSGRRVSALMLNMDIYQAMSKGRRDVELHPDLLQPTTTTITATGTTTTAGGPFQPLQIQSTGYTQQQQQQQQQQQFALPSHQGPPGQQYQESHPAPPPSLPHDMILQEVPVQVMPTPVRVQRDDMVPNQAVNMSAPDPAQDPYGTREHHRSPPAAGSATEAPASVFQEAGREEEHLTLLPSTTSPGPAAGADGSGGPVGDGSPSMSVQQDVSAAGASHPEERTSRTSRPSRRSLGESSLQQLEAMKSDAPPLYYMQSVVEPAIEEEEQEMGEGPDGEAGAARGGDGVEEVGAVAEHDRGGVSVEDGGAGDASAE